MASLSGSGSNQPSLGVLIGAILGGLLLGMVIVLAGLLYALHHRGGRLDLGRFGSIGGSKPRIPSSPHYLSAKQQNHYVSMGSLDYKKSSLVDNSCGSIAGGLSSSSTLPGRGHRPPPLRIHNTSVGVSTDYPTATIKRNSGGHNQMRTNIEADDNF